MSDPSANIQQLLRNSIQSIESVKKNLESYKNTNTNSQTLFKVSKQAQNKQLNREIAYEDLIETLNSVKGKTSLSPARKYQIERQIEEFQEQHMTHLTEQQRDILNAKAQAFRTLLGEENNSSQPNLVPVIPEKASPKTQENYKKEWNALGVKKPPKHFTDTNPYQQNFYRKYGTTAKITLPVSKPNKNTIKPRSVSAPVISVHAQNRRRSKLESIKQLKRNTQKKSANQTQNKKTRKNRH